MLGHKRRHDLPQENDKRGRRRKAKRFFLLLHLFCVHQSLIKKLENSIREYTNSMFCDLKHKYTSIDTLIE